MIINAQLDLTKIPKEKIDSFTRRDGSEGLSLNITIFHQDHEDQFGNDTSIVVSQTREERQAKEPRVYIGNGKSYKPKGESLPTGEGQFSDEKPKLPF